MYVLYGHRHSGPSSLESLFFQLFRVLTHVYGDNTKSSSGCAWHIGGDAVMQLLAPAVYSMSMHGIT